jgi:RNA polymerase sigma factor (sigma-70 family)
VTATDEELLESWRRGDTAAGEALFERHFDSLYRFFAHKVSGDVADMVQDTFVALVEGRERFRGQSSVRTYLFAIARNQLQVHLRALCHGRELDSTLQSVADLEPTPSQVLADKREQRALLEALRHIPLDLQIAVELHYWEGIQGPELAQVLEIPEGTVRSRLRRGLELLRARLAELEQSPEVLRSTLTDLDRWAEQLR